MKNLSPVLADTVTARAADCARTQNTLLFTGRSPFVGLDATNERDFERIQQQEDELEQLRRTSY